MNVDAEDAYFAEAPHEYTACSAVCAWGRALSLSKEAARFYFNPGNMDKASRKTPVMVVFGNPQLHIFKQIGGNLLPDLVADVAFLPHFATA